MGQANVGGGELKNSFSHKNCSNIKNENKKGWHNNALIMTFCLKAPFKNAKETIVCCNRKQSSLFGLRSMRIIIQYANVFR